MEFSTVNIYIFSDDVPGCCLPDDYTKSPLIFDLLPFCAFPFLRSVTQTTTGKIGSHLFSSNLFFFYSFQKFVEEGSRLMAVIMGARAIKKA